MNETPPRMRGKTPRNLVTLGMKTCVHLTWRYIYIYIYICIYYIYICIHIYPLFLLKWHHGGFLASTNFTPIIPLMETNNPHLTSSAPGLEACHVEDTSQASQPLNLRHVAPWLHRMGRHGQKHGEETWGLEKTWPSRRRGFL